MKKINFKFKFKYNIKIAIFTTSALFFLYLLYLSIPSLYDTGRVQKVLSDKLLANFDLNISLSTDISYSMLPQPHFSIKDSKLFTVKSNISHEFAEIKEVKIFIKQNNFFDKNNLSISKIDIYRANFFIKRDDFKFISYFFNKEFSKKKIKIKKSKIFFNDKKDNVIFIYTLNGAKFFNLKKNNINFFSTNGEIYKIPLRFEWSKDFTTQNTSSRLSTKKIFINFLNKSFFNDGKYRYENNLNISANKFKTNYEIKKKSIVFHSKKSIIKNTPIDYNGIINFQPFSFNLDVNTKELDLSYLLKNTYLLNEIILSKIIFNKSLNGKISVKSNKILKNKPFDKIDLKINFNEGEINFNNSTLQSDKIGSLKLYDSVFIEKEQKILLNAKLKLNINNLNHFYKILLIPKKNRKELKNIIFDITFDLTNGNIQINRVIFFINNDKKINSQKIDQVVEDNIYNKYHYSNWILFKNFAKKIIIAYSKEG